MSRYPLQTVTHPVALPVLVAEEAEKADGCCTAFPRPNRTSFVNVRVVTEAEIKRRLPKIFSSKVVSRTNEMILYVGAGQLMRAYEARDARALEDALKNVQPWVPRIPGEESVNADADKWEGARWDYSSLMSNAIQDARLVTWWPGNKAPLVSPGIYCPDWKTAAYVMLLMGTIRVCPKCGNPFVPKTDNQDYCTPAHGVAYRTARSRGRKKRANEEKKQKSGKLRKVRKSLR